MLRRKQQPAKVSDQSEQRVHNLIELCSGETLKLPIAKTETFYRPPWFQAAAEEFQATREAVSLCDYSSFAKMDLWSR